MNDHKTSGKRNLRILNSLGLACQAGGVITSMVFLIGGADQAWRGIISGMMGVVFGMALSGWAGNLFEIGALKSRVAALEKRAGSHASVQ